MKKIIAAVLCVLMILGLCACGATSKTAMSTSEAYYYADAAEAAMEVPAVASMYNGAVVAGNGMSDGSNAEEVEADTSSELNTEKIIYSAEATIETTDFSNVIEAIQKMVREKEGFIESSSINDNNYYSKSRGYQNTRSAYFTIRIPGNRFTEVMNGLETFGNVPYSYTYTQNVTSQYYDVQARADAYKAQEKRLIELLEKAESVEDIIVIEDKLSEVRYSIDRLQSNLNDYDRKIAYSTINLSVNEVVEYTPTEPVKRTFGEKLGSAIKNGFTGALEFMEALTLWLAEAIPTLILVGLILTGVVFGAKKIFRKTGIGKKRAKFETEKENNK